jgi:hypothetical protein
MATSHAAIVVILSLLLLASAQSSLVHARMMPSDVYAEDSSGSSTGSASSSSISQDMHRVFMASSRTPEAEIATANRRWTIQVVEGSVPSPGIGHHG